MNSYEKLSNRKMKVRVKRKTNPILAETIELAHENIAWKKVARYLSAGTRDYVTVNLTKLEKESSEGDTVVVLGKVLSSGNLTKKIRVCALSISEMAKEKLAKSKSTFIPLIEEIKTNKKAEGVKIIA